MFEDYTYRYSYRKHSAVKGSLDIATSRHKTWTVHGVDDFVEVGGLDLKSCVKVKPLTKFLITPTFCVTTSLLAIPYFWPVHIMLFIIIVIAKSLGKF